MTIAAAPGRASPRTPGLRFITLAPPLDEILPRMDVAVFVGFAASGPLNVPVVVEDNAQFVAIFGRDVPLAWDDERREHVYAYLAPAVRAFFRNGGRRCWIVRVSGPDAVANAFPICGLVNLTGTRARQATINARSEGSWSDDVRVAGSLQSRSIAVQAVDLAGLRLRVPSDADLVVGDLVCLTFSAEELRLFVTVAEVDARAVRCERPVWLALQTPPGAVGPVAASRTPGTSTFSINPAAPTSPKPGELLRIDAGPHRLLLTVDEITSRGVAGTGAWWLPSPPAPVPVWGGADMAEVVHLELWARHGTADPIRIGDLGLQAEHPRSWYSLPSDAELYALTGGQAGASVSALWQRASTPRFPLGGHVQLSAQTTTIPLGLPFLPTRFSAPIASDLLPLERDGLARFGPQLFVDPDLLEVGASALLSEADALRYSAAAPRQLTGIHAALGLDEATLMAVPDAVHRPWHLRSPGAPLRPISVAPRPGPNWSNFLPASTRVLSAPTLSADAADDTGTYVLSWTASVPEPAQFVLQEARSPDFADATDLYTGPNRQRVVYGRTPGAYYYRVRLIRGPNSSDWSAGVVVQVAPPSRWVLDASSAFSGDGLVAVHRAVLSLCAARGDVLAVLGLPSHYRAGDACQHVAALHRALVDERPLSFGTVYHPWTLGRDVTDVRSDIRRLPPDGSMSGIMARRALDRGAWVAAANVAVQGMFATEPALAPDDLSTLSDSHVNGIARQAGGFLAGGSETLSLDPDLQPVNVRRLMILVRRLALRHGTTYVFETHGDALRRRVQHGFEALLDLLLARGAFAGSTAETSYQVRVDLEEDRLVIDLAVAPALPMRFLTVRLIQSGGQTVAVEVP